MGARHSSLTSALLWEMQQTGAIVVNHGAVVRPWRAAGRSGCEREGWSIAWGRSSSRRGKAPAWKDAPDGRKPCWSRPSGSCCSGSDSRASRIQDIAELADVNRSTFYAYFPDKYALLESALRDRFRQVLGARFPATDGKWDATSVRLLIRSSYEFMMEVQRLSTPFDTQMELLLGKLVQGELTAILSAWLGRTKGSTVPAQVRLRTVVSAMSWVIREQSSSGLSKRHSTRRRSRRTRSRTRYSRSSPREWRGSPQSCFSEAYGTRQVSCMRCADARVTNDAELVAHTGFITIRSPTSTFVRQVPFQAC